MDSVVRPSRPFIPGTTGWTSHDLEDPEIKHKWLEGRYEIIDGVLTTMPPAYFTGSGPLGELVFILKSHLKSLQIADHFGGEVDIIIDEDRVVVADEVLLTPDDQLRQREAALKAGKSDPRRSRVLVPPTLVIESVSPGHERHDERTKRRWYAEFGVPNYWVLNAFARSLKCLVLDGGHYRTDVEGSDDEELHPTVFPGLAIPLARIWLD